VDIKPIKTNRDYRQALKKIETLMSAKANTPEGDRLDVLLTLVEAYERAHFPMDLPDAVEGLHTRFGIPAESLIKQNTQGQEGRAAARKRA
jgi:HTH-type transcriptional regulator/antitoxin HigA